MRVLMIATETKHNRLQHVANEKCGEGLNEAMWIHFEYININKYVLGKKCGGMNMFTA